MIDKKAIKVLKRLEATKDRYWNIPEETGEFLQLLVELKGARNILEIGTSNGYSGIYLASAARSAASAARDAKERGKKGKEGKHSGMLTTIEGDYKRAEEAKKNFNEAGLSNVDILFGEAREITKKLNGKFDFVFIDANKEQYLTYLKNIEGNLADGAVIVADNAISHKESMSDYFDYVGYTANLQERGKRNKKQPRYRSVLIPIGSGELISIRK